VRSGWRAEDAQGWGGPKEYKGQFIEGSFRAHQVPLTSAGSDPEQRGLLAEWLKSYDIHELIDVQSGRLNDDILRVVPEVAHKRLGMRKEAYSAFQPLDVPEWQPHAIERGTQESCMKATGELLHAVVTQFAAVSSLVLKER
jgi:xylulose-5-phosphate/fructose-6-phosphate phosphoketolase